jgi:caspase 7
MASSRSGVEVDKYKMDHEKRGTALVINIRSYENDKLKNREIKSRIDVENLKRTLEYLEFDFQLCDNFKAEEKEQEIQRQASQIDHSQSDCYLCVVMSHGNDKDMFYSNDNKEISYEDIMAPIKSCETLKNKPKLFFFQACRGNCDMRFERYNFNPTKARLAKIDYESDLLVYHSTFHDCLSWAKLIDNEPREGTIFVKSLCDVLSEAYKMLPNNLPLSQMITKINKSVSDQKWQLSDPKNTLTKEVFFTPKNVSVN